MENKCLWCGKELIILTHKKKYCNEDCRLKYNYNKNKILKGKGKYKCLWCGKEGDKTAVRQKFCSRSCRSKYDYKRNPIVKKNCLYCGKEFLANSGRPEIKYCSKACCQNHYKKNNKDRINFLNKKNYKNKIKTNSKMIYNRFKYRAVKTKNIEFKISYKMFLDKFWHTTCYYCGEDMESGGIDRVDSSVGYIEKNCVPCCAICNKIKNTLSVSDFLKKIKQINNTHKL